MPTPRPVPPPPLSASAERTLRALARESGAPALQRLRAEDLLTERARLLGLRFESGRAPGGACRLLDAADAPLAVNLPRASDWSLLPAWLEAEHVPPGASWDAQALAGWLAAAIRRRGAAALLDRARLLGLAVAQAAPPAAVPPPPWRIHGPPLAEAASPGAGLRPRVVDLSALWAGPLCGHLLHLCGADVVKVESVHRPDGARAGDPRFYGLMNQGKRSVALDFRTPGGRRALNALLATADIVIEASRPRALRQLGIDAEALLERHPRLTWVSITGYGRAEPEGNWVAFGDDAGVAAGLAEMMRRATGRPQFAGDAVADPLTGIRAALAAWRSWRDGGGRLIGLALAHVAAASLAEEIALRGEARLLAGCAGWWRHACGRRLESRGAPRPIRAAVAPLGAHTRSELEALGRRC